MNPPSTEKTILILGASGFIGSSLARALRPHHKVYGGFYQNPVYIPGQTPVSLDVREPDLTRRIIGQLQPDTVIYAVGSNSPDRFDQEKHNQETRHSLGISNILNACDYGHSQVIYLSNDYIFAGDRGGYLDTEKAAPDRELGKSKVTGESYVRSRSLNYIVLRSGPVYGIGPARSPSCYDELRNQVSRGLNFSLSDSERHSFVSVDYFCRAVRALIENQVRNKTLHLATGHTQTWYEWGKKTAKDLGLDDSRVIKAEVDDDEKQDLSLVSSALFSDLLSV